MWVSFSLYDDGGWIIPQPTPTPPKPQHKSGRTSSSPARAALPRCTGASPSTISWSSICKRAPAPRRWGAAAGSWIEGRRRALPGLEVGSMALVEVRGLERRSSPMIDTNTRRRGGRGGSVRRAGAGAGGQGHAGAGRRAAQVGGRWPAQVRAFCWWRLLPVRVQS